MRDLVICIVVFGSLPFIVVRPDIGILVWSWIGYMNPHRLSWGFARDFPFAFIVAIATLIAIVISREQKRIPITGLTIMWVLFIGWMILTTMFAFYPSEAWPQLGKVLKIQLMSFVTIMVMCSRERLRNLIWVIVLSLGYFGFKGGLFTILTAGDFRVWGPPDSFVEGNNEIALALLITLPLMHYLRMTSTRPWVRFGLLIGMILCAFSIVGSQSRGAFLGGFAMAFFLWLKSKHKAAVGAVLLLLIPLLFAFMPQQWYDRMRTIETYENDESAMGRIVVWRMAVRVANDRLLGGGFEQWTQQTFDHYSPENNYPRDAHSIYFKVLGEHGWIGLALFLGIGIAAWRTGSWIIRRTRDRDDLRWLSDLARMIQVSLGAYAAGGAFLGLSYFDLYWHLVAMLVVGKALLQREIARTAAQPIGVGDRLATPLPGVGAVHRETEVTR